MKHVLIAPLDWGLGHATRCIPIIREFLKRNCKVSLAGSGDSLALLQAEFPLLESFTLAAYNPTYPSTGSMVWKMARQLPHFFRTIRQEYIEIQKIVEQQRIDLIISDNRYGCRCNKVTSVFITHQSNILMPKRFGWLAPFVRLAATSVIRKFSICWIPDLPGIDSLSGELSAYKHRSILVRNIGLISRFNYQEVGNKIYDLLCIFSGPEPQRSVLEQLVANQLNKIKGKILVVRGVLGGKQHVMFPENCEVVNFLKASELEHTIASSMLVLSRSGYSTIMDLFIMGKNAILVPTPGQTEQEYLAARLKERGIMYSVAQSQLDLHAALDHARNFSGFAAFNKPQHFLEQAIDEVLQH